MSDLTPAERRAFEDGSWLGLGTVVVDEEVLHITKVTLDEGLILIHATGRERRTCAGKWIEDFVVFGADGMQIIAAKVRVFVPARIEGSMSVTLPLKANSC